MSIVVDGFVKAFGDVTVVHNISFKVDSGEFVSLLGPSGCGKTTTLRAIAGLEETSGGVISISGHVVSAPGQDIMVPPHQRDIGMVFQSYAIWPHMTVAENVSFPLKVRGLPAAMIERELVKALAIVGLEHLRERRPSQLSGGQQQRVALARAVVGSPKILLFDEPLSNLDAKLRESTRAEIRRLQRELGIAALYVTHDQEEALSMSDRVVVMNEGRIVQQASPKELYRRPSSRFAANFVGKANFVKVARTNGGWHSPDGSAIRFAVTEADAGRTSGEAMVRPEAVRLRRADCATAEAGIDDNLLLGRVIERQYMGAHTEYLVEAAGSEIRAYSEEDFDIGAPVQLGIPPASIRLLHETV